MLTVNRLQTNSIVDGLVTHYLISGDIDKPHRLGGRNYSGHILIDSELFHLLIGVLGLQTEEGSGAQEQSAETDSYCGIHIKIVYIIIYT